MLWIDNPSYGNCIYKLKEDEYQEDLNFIPNETLFGYSTSITFALDWAIRNGYKKATLLGVLDGHYKLVKRQGIFCGHWLFEYRHFYDNVIHHKQLLQIMQFKNAIFEYSNRIQIEIPYRRI